MTISMSSAMTTYAMRTWLGPVLVQSCTILLPKRAREVQNVLEGSMRKVFCPTLPRELAKLGGFGVEPATWLTDANASENF